MKKNNFNSYIKYVGKTLCYKQKVFDTNKGELDLKDIPMKVIGIVLINHIWNFIFSLNKNTIELKVPCKNVLSELSEDKYLLNNPLTLDNNINEEDYADFSEEE